MGTLELSFYGPFAYFFNSKSATVDIYAPKCPGHRASISSVKDQFPLKGRSCNGKSYCYELGSKGIQPGPGTIDESTHILRTKKSLSPKADSFFRLRVPKPSLVHGIHEDGVELVTSMTAAPKGSLRDTATALRFYYIFDMTSEICISAPVCQTSEPLGYIQPNVPGSGKVNHVDITVRYESAQQEDVDHIDAQECFMRLRDLLGLPWWVSYDKNLTVPKIRVRTGVDCRAPVVVSES